MNSKYTPQGKLTFWLGLAALLFLAFTVRLYNLDSIPLRGDEAYSVMHWTATPFSESWQHLVRHEPAPVGAFTMYWAWNGLTGTSEFATRYLSLLGNVAGMAVTMTLARRLLHDWRLALMVGILWIAHPFLIWHAQDARTYGVLSALTPLTFYWLLRAVAENGQQSESSQIRPLWVTLRPWRPYILVQTLAIYIYYFEPFWIVAQLLFVLLLRRWDTLKRAVVAWVIIGILSIPVIAQLYTLMFVSQYEGNAASADFPALFSGFVPALLLGADPIPTGIGVLFVAGLLGGLLCVYRHNQRFAQRGGLVLLFWIIVPPLLLYAVSFISSFFRPRYTTTVVPALLIALVAVAALATSRRRVSVAAGLTVVLALASLVEVNDYFHNDPPKSANLPALMAYIQDYTTPHDVVISSQVDPAMEYYFAGQGDLYILPIDWTASADEVNQLLVDYQDVVLLSDSGTAEIGQLLQAQAQQIPGDRQPDLVRYRHWVVDPDEIQIPLDVDFGNVARLRGYTLIGQSILLLYWEALSATDADHSALLHMELAPDQPVVVLDHAIASAVVSTRTWTPGVIYRDPVALPSNLRPGDYTIYIGFKTGSGDLLSFDAGTDDRRFPAGVLHVTE